MVSRAEGRCGVRVVVDALAAHGGDSYVVVLENLLAGWSSLETGDDLHLVVTPHVELRLPPDVTVHTWPTAGTLQRVLLQSTRLPRLCRALGADALLSTLPASSMVGTGCPRAITVYDLRHELRPEQFSGKQRLLRRLAYGRGYHQADSVICASERTRDDLLRSRPWLARTPLTVALLGADHVRAWHPREVAEPYALAFGQTGNKNVEQVIAAWAVLAARGAVPRLALVGIRSGERQQLTDQVAALGIAHLVDLLPWLTPTEFESTFASASLVVFPSDFEGFGLPAPEAMVLGIPVVVSDDPALREVSGGHATVVHERSGQALADAVTAALATPPEALQAAREFASRYTWAGTAAGTRAALEDAIAARSARRWARVSSSRSWARTSRKASGRYM
jgi:glycosyltransferase involved in cell wall biosynthesis